MQEHSSEPPERVKATPRLKIRRHQELKKSRKNPEQGPASSEGVNELSAVLRLLERLSEKPAGKALLQSVIASSAAAAPDQPAGATAPQAVEPGRTPDKAEPHTSETVETEPLAAAPAATPPPDSPGKAAELRLVKGESQPLATGPETIPGGKEDLKAAEPIGQEKAPSDPQATLDEAMGAALEEALVESEEEDETLPDDDAPPEEGETFLARQRRRARRRSERRRQTRPNWKAAGFPLIRLALMVLLGLSLFASGIIIAYTLGLREQKRIAKNRPSPVLKDGLAPDDAAQLDLALAAIREGNPQAAIPILGELAKRQPPIPSVSYLRAIAALQAEDSVSTKKFAQESIDKGERISDSHALLAQATPGNAETQLRKAVAADPANPFPLMELAYLKRKAGQNAESLQLLRSARLRLLPVDTHIATEVQETLIRLEGTETKDLPDDPPGSSRVARLWSQAYLSLRRNEPEKAAEALSMLALDTEMDLFRYLITEPSFRLYQSEPKIERFFKM